MNTVTRIGAETEALENKYPQWMIDAHKITKSTIKTRTCSFDEWGYDADCDPFQVVITASGWKAKILAFLFRIPPCMFSYSDEQCWPKKDLYKKVGRRLWEVL